METGGRFPSKQVWTIFQLRIFNTNIEKPFGTLKKYRMFLLLLCFFRAPDFYIIQI